MDAGDVVEKRSPVRWATRLFSLVLAAGALWGLARLHGHPDYGRASSWVFLVGLSFGWVLQRSRFCFFCMLRDLFEGKDSRAALGVLLALAVGITAHVVLFTAWIPNPLAGHLPPRAHIGPVSWATALGGFVFGVGMAMSGSCISAHLYRLGEGSLLAPFALAGTLAGGVLGLLTWNPLYLRVLSSAPVVWLPAWRGFSLSWVIGMVVLAVMAFVLLRWISSGTESPLPKVWNLKRILKSVFVERWSPWAGGLAVGMISTAALFRGAPLGVTAEWNRLARLLGDHWSWLPARLEGLDAVRGCRIAADTAFFTPNGLFIMALVIGGLIGIAGTGTISPSRPKPKAFPLALLGGILLGWGGFIALGCTIGTLLSGIHAGALSGWVFGLSMVLGVWVALPLRQWAER